MRGVKTLNSATFSLFSKQKTLLFIFLHGPPYCAWHFVQFSKVLYPSAYPISQDPNPPPIIILKDLLLRSENTSFYFSASPRPSALCLVFKSPLPECIPTRLSSKGWSALNHPSPAPRSSLWNFYYYFFLFLKTANYPSLHLFKQ